MNDRKIISSASIRYNPAVIGLLSLVFTGLGQVLTARASIGSAVLMLRTLFIAVAAATSFDGVTGSPAEVTAVCAAGALLVILYSPVSAVFSVYVKNVISLKRYNRAPVYAAFISLNVLLSAASIMMLSFSYRIYIISSPAYAPAVLQGDAVLVNVLPSGTVARGDLVMLNDGSLTRVIALEGDTADITSNEVTRIQFFVNGVSSYAGILNDAEIRELGIGYYDGLYAEYGDGVKYAVIYDRKMKAPASETVKVPQGMLLTADDSRLKEKFYSLIDRKSVSGKIAGIIISDSFERLFAKPSVKSNRQFE